MHLVSCIFLRVHSYIFEAIVLRTVDLGEADRFCILLTRERGRIAARARAVRRLQSHMGGTLLPLRHVRVHMKEWSGGWLITSAVPASDDSRVSSLRSFTIAEQGMELLLGLLEDDHPLPEVFDLTVELLRSAEDAHSTLLLAYTIRLLDLLGLMPESTNTSLFIDLAPEDRLFVKQCCDRVPLQDLTIISSKKLEIMTRLILSDQLRSPLRATAVAAALREPVEGNKFPLYTSALPAVKTAG